MRPVPTVFLSSRPAVLYLVKAIALSWTLLICATLASPARAGTWRLTASGSGSATASAGGVAKQTANWTSPAPATGSITLASVSNGAAWQTVSAPAPVRAAAKLSATVTGTWVPDPNLSSDPPPTCVILAKTSTATGVQSYTDSNDNGVTTAGMANDWLGDPVSTKAPTIGTASGTHYAVVTPNGTTFALNVSLSASSGATSGPNGFDGDGDYFTGSAVCSAGVGPVTISAYAVTVDLSGVTLDPSDGNVSKVLTGQQVTAALDIHGAPGTVSFPDSQNDVDWDVVGNGTLGGYDPSQTEAQIQPIDEDENTVQFYDWEGNDSIVVTGHASIIFPDGTRADIEATSQTITAIQPTVKPWTPSQATYDNFSQHPNDTSSLYGVNEIWSPILITVPAPFSGGTGGFVQTLNTNSRYDFRHTGTQYISEMLNSLGNPIPVPAPARDANFPYQYTLQTNPDGTLVMQNGSPVASNSATWSVSSAGAGVDGPGLICAPPLVSGDAGMNDWYYSDANDTWTTWVMYLPPGSNSIWAPLKQWDWSWIGNASLNAGLTPSRWQEGGSTGTAGSQAVISSYLPEWDSIVPAAGSIFMGPIPQ